MKKVISFVCFLLILCLLSTTALAANPDPVDPEFTRVSTICAGLDISSTGEAFCSGSVTPYYATDTVTLTVRLQYRDGNVWRDYSPATTWSITSSGIVILLDESAQVAYGYTYRVRVSAKCVAASGGASETVYCNSPTKSYP